MSKVYEILRKHQSAEEKAKKYESSIKRNLEQSMITDLIRQKEALEDAIDDMLNFSLDTDFNKGRTPVNKADAQARFEKAMNMEYDLELLKREIDIREKIFKAYFDESSK